MLYCNLQQSVVNYVYTTICCKYSLKKGRKEQKMKKKEMINLLANEFDVKLTDEFDRT